MRLFSELKRRNVFRAVIGYVVVAWLILQVTDVLSDILRLPPWPSQLVLLALLVGLPIVVLISWLFELTPGGFRRETDGEMSGPDEARITTQKIDRTIIAVLAVAVAILIANSYLLPRLIVDEEDVSALSVAVLPFVNMSSDPETEFFSDGLSEELLNVLAQVQSFRVPARTSSFAFKDRNMDLREIGALLNVENLLEGSVRKQGDKIRITAQLNEAENGYHLWSATYDRELDDIFAIQDEIAAEVVKALKHKLLDEDRQILAKRGTENPDAYQSYLRGRHYYNLRIPEGYEKALAEFIRAAEFDSHYASAWAGQALVYGRLPSYRLMEPEEAQELGRAAIQRAQELDNNDYWVQYATSVWAESHEERVAALERAIELNPNDPDAYVSLAWVQGPFIEGSPRRTELLRMAYERDPLSLRAVEQYSIQLANVGELEYGMRLLRELRSFNPEWVGTYETMARMYDHKGNFGKAATELRFLRNMHPELGWIPFWLARHHMIWGDYELARQYLDDVGAFSSSSRGSVVYRAVLAARRGELADAYRVVSDFARADKTTSAQIVLAQIALLSNEPELAAEHADNYFAHHSDSGLLDYHMTAAVAYHKVGRLGDAKEQAQWVIAQANLAEANGMVHWLWPQSRSAASALLGDTNAALNDLATAIDLGYRGVSIVERGNALPQFDLFYEVLRDNLRYQELVRVVDQSINSGRQYFESNHALPAEGTT